MTCAKPSILIVYAEGKKVGILDMADSEPFYGFTYDPAYLSADEAVPLSLTLPLRESRFAGAETLPFFEGLLPEGDVRSSIARQLGISEHSPAKLLRALGRDCAGDVTVLEPDDPYQPPADDCYVLLDGELSEIARNPSREISRLRAKNRLSLAGGQEKIALYHDTRAPLRAGWFVPLSGSPSTHIVKPQTRDAYPQLAFNEFFCMTLAQCAGIPTAHVHLIEHAGYGENAHPAERVFAGKTDGFAQRECPLLIIERFDREETGRANDAGLAVFRRLRQEDFCQAMGFDSSRKYETDGGPGISDMTELLIRHSVNAIEDRKTLLRLVLFNYLVGNCDAHGKNYSLKVGRNGGVRLAPAYDLLSTCVYDGDFGAEFSRGMGMRIGQHANIDHVTSADFAELAEQIGMPTRLFAQIAGSLVEDVLTGFKPAEVVLRASVFEDTDLLTEKIHRGVVSRAHIIWNAYQVRVPNLPVR